MFPRRSFLLEECCGKVLYYLRSLLLLSLYTDFEGLNVRKLVEHHSSTVTLLPSQVGKQQQPPSPLNSEKNQVFLLVALADQLQ